MAKSKNSSAVRPSKAKNTKQTKDLRGISDVIPYVDTIKDSSTYFCWTEPFAFHVHGSAMVPQFNAGDTVIIDPNRKPVDGDFVIAGLPGHPIVFRKFACSPDAPYQLLATNPKYAPLDPVLPVIGVMTVHHCKIDDRREVERSFISSICAAEISAGDSSEDRNESPFLLTASQVNTDLALAGQCEFEDDLSVDDPDDEFFDLLRSTIYRKLRETFIEDAMKGDKYSFLTAIWRAYNAGRLSPDRLVPHTRKVREDRTAVAIARTLAATVQGAHGLSHRESHAK